MSKRRFLKKKITFKYTVFGNIVIFSAALPVRASVQPNYYYF